MNISLEEDGDSLCFHLEPEDSDIEHLNSSKIGLAGGEARINLGGLVKNDSFITDTPENKPQLVSSVSNMSLFLPKNEKEQQDNPLEGGVPRMSILEKFDKGQQLNDFL